MLVFTAFYSLELPFIFYRCQQLGAPKKCYHFRVTNCHHLRRSLDVTCAWSLRNLRMNCSIYTLSFCLTYFRLVHTNIALFNNSKGGISEEGAASKQGETWVHGRGRKDGVTLSFSRFDKILPPKSVTILWCMTACTFTLSLIFINSTSPKRHQPSKVLYLELSQIPTRAVLVS